MAAKKVKVPSARSQQNLIEKRRVYNILRDAGLLKKKGGRVTEKYLRESSYLRQLRRDFADVISGATKPLKVPRFKLPEFKSAGFRIHNGRIIADAGIKRATSASNLTPPPPPPQRPRSDKGFNDCLRRVLEWFDANHDPKQGDYRERRANLIQHARENPEAFRGIINASNALGRQYLAGQPRTINPWPDSEVFRSLYGELYYYKPSEYSHNVTGGLIPRC